MSSQPFLSGSFPHGQCVGELETEIGAAVGFRSAHHPAVPTPEFLIATWLKRREWEGLMRVWSLFALRKFWKALETISLSCWHYKKYWKTMEFGQDAQTPETTRLSLGIFRSSFVGFPLEDFWGFFEGNFVLGKQSWARMKRWDMIFRVDQLREKFHGARAKVKSFRSLLSKLHTARLWKKVIISKWPCKMGSAQSQNLRFCISTISNLAENRQVDTMYHLPTTMCSE